jgi:predicted metal-dependent hydrolase
MQKEIAIGNQKIHYTLRQSRRAKRARLTVNCEGNLVVTLPHFFFFGESAAEKFIQAKAAWVLRTLNYFAKHRGQYFFRSSRREFIKYKEIARTRALERINYFNTFYHFPVGKISIRNQKTRWGSCSRQGNLNFNYKIALLPEKVADYIIVHELCHLKEFNHSADFWNLVSKTVPDYKTLRKKIRGK